MRILEHISEAVVDRCKDGLIWASHITEEVDEGIGEIQARYCSNIHELTNNMAENSIVFYF
jgi:hypothetical protein